MPGVIGRSWALSRIDRLGILDAGHLVALGNPKLIVFFVALLSQFVSADLSMAGRWLIVATATLVDGGWYQQEY